MNSESPRAFSMISMHRECTTGGIGRTAASRRLDTSEKTSHRSHLACARHRSFQDEWSVRPNLSCYSHVSWEKMRFVAGAGEDGGLLPFKMRLGLARNICQEGLIEVNCGRGAASKQAKTVRKSSEWRLMRHLPFLTITHVNLPQSAWPSLTLFSQAQNLPKRLAQEAFIKVVAPVKQRPVTNPWVSQRGSTLTGRSPWLQPPGMRWEILGWLRGRLLKPEVESQGAPGLGTSGKTWLEDGWELSKWSISI